MDARNLVFALVSSCFLAAHCAASDFKYGSVQTIEWLAADADVVVRATILDASPPRADHWSKAKARSVESIKGHAPAEFEFAARSLPDLLPTYRDRELVLFLISKERHSLQQDDPTSCPWVLRSGGEGWAIIGLDGNPEDFAVTMDFSVMVDPEAIMKATRTAVEYSSSRPRPKLYRPTISGVLANVVTQKMPTFRLPAMYMPLDERLEPKAREWIKSPNPHIRLEGCVALRRYRSDENIAALKALLTDPACEGGCYLVRTAAFNTLTDWGIDCGQPVLNLSQVPDRRL